MKECRKEVQQALRIAASALEIANDNGVPAVQCDPPKEWDLGGGGEDPGDGWCSTRELAFRLEQLARRIDVAETTKHSFPNKTPNPEKYQFSKG